MEEKKKANILHILFVSENKTSGVRNVVPQHLEYQSQIANVALLNCNDTEVEEAEGKYNVYKLKNIANKEISNLPGPFNRPDLVVFHAIYYPQYIKLYKQCKKNNIPYIIVPHGSLTTQAQKQKWIKKIPANILLFNDFIKKAAAVQFLTEGEKQKSRKCKKHIIAGNGINLINNEYKRKKSKEFKVIYIGRYDTYTKGLDLLIKAVKIKQVFLRENNIKIVLYGTDYRGRQKKIKKLILKYRLEDIIEMKGPVWGKEKEEVLHEADIFIQPSRTEGQPVGLMEAISIGLPCIITKETNFGDFVEKNNIGWVVKTTSTHLATKLEEAFSQKDELYKMRERAKDCASKDFKWENIAQATIEKYIQIIKEYGEKTC